MSKDPAELDSQATPDLVGKRAFRSSTPNATSSRARGNFEKFTLNTSPVLNASLNDMSSEGIVDMTNIELDVGDRNRCNQLFAPYSDSE